ncbi:TonB-dependent receptor [Niastella yeongjuensis]|uniref:TonB-dependent receptor n=1 Tax=Niastella yeongjuensis TaxID=354355 RepID=UPI0008B8F98F|nr:TonB-dependent receptor [Niastella yeongjuensis]SEO79759.1 iron complex outermembrane recepter protein [Niastella yeongjuensis]
MNRLTTLALVILLINNQLTAQTANLAAPAANTTETPVEKETGIVKGTIQTTDNQPAAYVTVTLKDAGRATFTDEYGTYSLKNIKPGQYVLKVTMAGLQSKEETIVVKANETTVLDFKLAEDRKQLEEIVVTQHKTLNDQPVNVGKISLNPMDVPQALSVIGQGQIREQQALKLSDVIRNVNGVYLTTTRGNVQESFGARGYALGSTNLFKNGFRINSGVIPEMSSLEKVEVLKGSGAILYGQVAPGGVVNMVTKQPKFNFGGEVSLGAGSYGLIKPAFDVYGPISKSIAYRINGTYMKANSFRDQVSSERYYVNPSLLFKLGKRTELIAEGDYLNDNFTPDFGIGSLDGKQIPNVGRSTFFGTPWQYNKTQQTTTTLTVRHQLSTNWKLNASFSDQYYKRDYYSVERVQADATGKWARPLGRINSNEKFYAGQINLIGKFNTAKLEHNLLTGIDADRTETYNKDYDINGKTYDTINILDASQYKQRTDIPEANGIRERLAPVNRFGGYVQDLIKLSDKFNVLAGVRWAYVETRGIDSTSLTDGKKTTGATRYDNAFSPRFGLVYKPFQTTSFFVSYSNSFTTNTGQDLDGKAIKPSIIDQYEVGVKNQFLNGLLSTNVTLYRIINNNLAQMASNLRDGSINVNPNIKLLSGETTSDGVEVDVAASPIPGLNITAGYSYNYMRYTKTDTTVGSFKTGERLVNNPAHTANGSIFYTFGNGRLEGFKIGTTIVYLGKRFGGWNTDVTKTSPVTYRDRLIAVSGYTTIDITAGYTFRKKISLLAKVSNLTNTYNVSVHENYSVNPIPPTQFVATLSYKF